MTADTAKVIFVIGLVLFAFIRYPQEFVAWRTAKHKSARPAVERLLLAIAAAGLVFLPILYVAFHLPRFADWRIVPALAWLGAMLFLSAQLVLYVAHRALGKNFSSRLVVRKGHTLVSHGIYTHVRHPMYSGFWLWAIGQALLLPNWVAGLAGLIGFGTLYYLRVGREEEMMIETFGGEYRAYMSRTSRVLPLPRFARRAQK